MKTIGPSNFEVGFKIENLAYQIYSVVGIVQLIHLPVRQTSRQAVPSILARPCCVPKKKKKKKRGLPSTHITLATPQGQTHSISQQAVKTHGRALRPL